eukprot:142737-Hanusia_phi.AAC.1
MIEQRGERGDDKEESRITVVHLVLIDVDRWQFPVSCFNSSRREGDHKGALSPGSEHSLGTNDYHRKGPTLAREEADRVGINSYA